MLKRFIVVILFAVSFTGVAKAQEATGETAEKVKKEFQEVEEGKRQAMLASGNKDSAQWIRDHYADGMEHTSPDRTHQTKEQMVALLETGERDVSSRRGEGVTDHVHIYGTGGNGTTVVVTSFSLHERDKKASESIEVWVKLEGRWWMVAHNAHPRPPSAKSVDEPE